MNQASFITLITVQKVAQDGSYTVEQKMADVALCTMFNRYDGRIGFVGGKTELNETSTETAYREFYEETGVSIDHLKGQEQLVYQAEESGVQSTLYAVYLHPKEFYEIVRQFDISGMFSDEGSPMVVHLHEFSESTGVQQFAKHNFAPMAKGGLLTLIEHVAELGYYKKQDIFFDCDMVLLDFNEAIKSLYTQKTGIEPNVIDSNAFKVCLKYDIPHTWVKENCNSNEFWGNMPVMKYHDGISAVEVVNKLAKRFNVHVLTNMQSKFKAVRLKNLWDHGFNVHSVISTDGVEKSKFIEANGGGILVDDLLKHINFDANAANSRNIPTMTVFVDHSYSDDNKTVYEHTPECVIKNLSEVLTIVETV